MTLILLAILSKSRFALQENALQITKSNSEKFLRYAPYRRRDMQQTSICSPRKMPFTVHMVTKKCIGDMPFRGSPIWQKSLSALL